MAFLEYFIILFLLFNLFTIIIIIYSYRKQKTVIPTNWPLLGMIPGILVNTHRLLDYVTGILMQSGGTVLLKGPWFANLDMLLTTDPLDIHHILSKNFTNYPKGDKFRKIFESLGDGVLNSDGDIWEMNRKIIFSVFKQAGFQSMMEKTMWNKVETGLLPILESICRRGTEIDLQDVFQRFALDSVCILLLDSDPQSLSIDFPYIPCYKAFANAEQALLLRHLIPPFLWKVQQILKVGTEKKFKDAWKNVDEYIYKCLDKLKEECNNKNHKPQNFLFVTAIMNELTNYGGTSVDQTKFLRDTIHNLMAAGKDTVGSALCWFFYLIAKNPAVEDKILEEMQPHLEVNARKRWSTKELDEMVYLHGALCESLRLYPPVPFNHKSPVKPEILPSGHKVDQNSKIILSFYSMARMKSIWGEDCMEFKPERWISNDGGIKNEPSYKFTTFNAGPRACLGKNMAFSQLKIVVTTIIYHYQIQLVEGHPVLPEDSIILHMQHGLKVRLNRRSELN